MRTIVLQVDHVVDGKAFQYGQVMDVREELAADLIAAGVALEAPKLKPWPPKA